MWLLLCVLPVVHAVPGRGIQISELLAQTPEGRLDARIVDEVAQVVEAPPPVLELSNDEPVPPHLTGLSPEVLQAWSRARAVAALAPPPVGDGSGPSELTDAIDDLLAGRDGDVHQRILNTGWNAFCGTGAGRFYGPRSRALFLAALLEGDHGLAAARAVDAAHFGWEPWQRAYVSWLGLELDELILGAAVHGRDPAWLDALAAPGGDRAARLTLWAGEVADPTETREWRSQWLMVLSRFVARSHEPGADPRFASEERQLQILGVLGDTLRPGVAVEEQQSASWALRRLERPESEAALRRAATLSSVEVAQRAAATLKRLGLTVEVAIPPDARFVLTAPGGPLASTTVEWEVDYEGPTLRAWNLTTSVLGTASIERAMVDGSGKRVASVRFRTHEPSWDDALFDVRVEPPVDWDAITEVELDLLPLRLALPDTEAAEATVVLSTHAGMTSFRFRAPIVAGVLRVPRLQRGVYDLSVAIPDAAVWTRSGVRVGAVEVALRPGGSLDYRIVAPGGHDADRVVVELRYLDRPRAVRDAPDAWLREGVVQQWLFAGPEAEWVGLPAGDYELKALSSEERLALNWFPNPPARHPHEGSVHRFTIAPGATVQLGDVVLPE